MTSVNQKIVLLDEVDLHYDDIEVFDKFSLMVPKGKITTIVGPSGCGKSSLLNLLAGLVPVQHGRVLVEDATVGYIFQEDRLLPWETVYQNVRLVRPEENHEEIMAILTDLELDGFAHKYPKQLSGGMRQRVSIARGFYYHSTLLLMDEPFKSLDYDLRLNLVRYLGELWQSNENTIIFVTHDIDEALLLGHQILVLSRRPSKIAVTYEREAPLRERSVEDQEHIDFRREIVKQMSMKED